jgi:hypothetical protein
MSGQPIVGRHCPANYVEFLSWFSTDAHCRDYLEWLRWPNGFVCALCGSGGFLIADGRYECGTCHTRTSVTAGTIFARTRVPLTVWFNACWHIGSGRTAARGPSSRAPPCSV